MLLNIVIFPMIFLLKKTVKEPSLSFGSIAIHLINRNFIEKLCGETVKGATV